MRLHQSGVWRYLRTLGCDCSLADDLTQETFLRFFHVYMQERFQERNEKSTAAYLRSIAYNAFLKTRQKQERESQAFLLFVKQVEKVWLTPLGEQGGEVFVDALRICLKKLKPRMRQALDSKYQDGSSRKELAQLLDLSENGVKDLLRRAKEQLRECIRRKLGVHENDDVNLRAKEN